MSAHGNSGDSGGANLPRLATVSVMLLALAFACHVSGLDDQVVRALNPDHPSALDGVNRWLNANGPRLLVAVNTAVLAVALLLTRAPSLRFAPLVALVTFVPLQLVVRLLKGTSARPRPLLHLDGLREIVALADTRSFPSGDAATAFVMLLPWALAARGPLRAALLAPAVSVLLSRVSLAVHHPSDVLAGAALGILATGAIVRLLAPRREAIARSGFGVRHPWFVALMGILVITLYLDRPFAVTDLRTGSAAAEFRFRSEPLRTVFEPLVGPVLHVSGLSGITGSATRCLPWLLAGAVLWIVSAGNRGRRRRMLMALGAACVLAVPVAVTPVRRAILTAAGGLPSGHLTARGPGIFFDTHIHHGDPRDGLGTLEGGLRKARRTGFGAVFVTHHDRAHRGGPGFPGMEWSPDIRATHLLLLGGDPDRYPPPHVRDWQEALRAGREAGAVVIAAHPWRADPYVPPRDFALAGVDGFEISNRGPLEDPGQAAVAAEARRLAVGRGLILTAGTDDHGWQPFVRSWNFAPGLPRPDTGLEEVMAALRARRTVPLALEQRRSAGGFRVLVEPFALAADYFAGLPRPSRVSWALWAVALLGAAVIVRRIRGRGRAAP